MYYFPYNDGLDLVSQCRVINMFVEMLYLYDFIMSYILLARLYESTGRAIAITPASALAFALLKYKVFG